MKNLYVIHKKAHKMISWQIWCIDIFANDYFSKPVSALWHMCILMQSSPPRPKMDISPQQRVLRQPPHGNPRQAPPPQIDTGHHPAFRNNGLLQIAPQMTKSPHSSQTRMSINRKSLREISTEELRKSVVSSLPISEASLQGALSWLITILCVFKLRKLCCNYLLSCVGH